MSDNRNAKLVLSAIIGKEIINLKFRNAERQSEIDARIKYHFLDFSAEILNDQGERRTVIKELHKSVRLPAVVIRFRRYLGEQYSSLENTYTDKDEHGVSIRKPIPIISIYIMGKKLYHTSESPVIRIHRKAIDSATNEAIEETNDFVENLTHDSIIIQTPYLAGKRRNELEQLLSVFDQSGIDKKSEQIINIKENEYPAKYKEVIRRLKKAASTPEVRKVMNTEDEVAEEYKNLSEALVQKDHEIDNERKQKEEASRQKEEAYRTIEKTVLNLKKHGMNIDQIAEIVDKSVDDIKGILAKS